ncbi:MAG: hypothetical protein HYS98_01005 [Deltaproteobacteria bacterium]|nr:hypothetical protein [Deltaproteobacteria bacterium]
MKEQPLISSCNRNLERAVKIFGFEIFDLLFLGICLAVLHIFTDGIKYGGFLSWIISAFIAISLYFTKKQRPENFLLYKIKYLLIPPTYFATSFDLKFKPYLKNDKPT